MPLIQSDQLIKAKLTPHGLNVLKYAGKGLQLNKDNYLITDANTFFNLYHPLPIHEMTTEFEFVHEGGAV